MAWSAVRATVSTDNAHGAQMHRGVGILEQAKETEDPVEVYAVMNRATASALKVIMRPDDSSGMIGPTRVGDYWRCTRKRRWPRAFRRLGWSRG